MQFSKTILRAAAPPNTGTSLCIGQIPHNFIRMNKGFSIQKSILASALMAVLLASVTLVIALVPLYTTQSAAATEEEKNKGKGKGKGQGNKNDQAREELIQGLRGGDTQKDAKIATSGDNVYIAWGSNKTSHPDIMFRASTDSGKTFGEKINLSNTSNVDSVDREIAASGSNVFVAWWERGNQTDEAVMKISTDNGKTFGPMLKLAANGTIGGSSGGG